MDNNPTHLDFAEVSRLKWIGIEATSLKALEERQRMRVKALREQLEAEEQELTWIIAAGTASPVKAANHHGTVHAPAAYTERMTWKDKIILAVTEAKRPLLAREIASTLKSWEHKERHRDIDGLVSVLLSQLVRDGAVVRTKRKGQSGALHGLPG